MILYFAPNTRALRARWLLEEMGVPYELARVDLAHGGQRTPEYLRIHPLGAVPALVDGDRTIIESAAICLHLADRFPGFAPSVDSPLRAHYYQYCVFAVATLDPIVAPVFARGHRWPEARRRETATDEEHERFRRTVGALRPSLLKQAFLVGDQFTAADVLVGSVLAWADAVGLMQSAKELQPYLARLTERAAYRRALTDG
ncbi:MAG: glutathione S-transferase family protein [Polyangiales bacterium]